ncbi:MAG: 4-hydroxythreonine-4-phosphate dehydrogenase PdxA [Balneolales bacterium]
MNNSNEAPVIGITMGDPSGIGPEIILKSYLNNEIKNCKIVVIGDYDVMLAAHDMLNIDSYELKKISDPRDSLFHPDQLNILDIDVINISELKRGEVQAASGDAAFKCISESVALAKKGAIHAVVTAPINKEALHLAGHKYPGHTEILGILTDTRDYAMLLYDRKLSVIHVSTHISLLKAITGLKKERIEKVIELAHDTMKNLDGKAPRIAVAGLNPHAGEKGLFGDEERKIIIPAVNHMKSKGYHVSGPLPPDTVFLQTVEGKYDIVVAMYHDQGHIPLKLLGFHSGVNVTVGLPILRTSVDHGTAFDIAWHGKASEESMLEAIRLASKIVQ